tara:strand:- start:64 stop:393 length:330 start_codon:yes stop_codon:yes gene_type:complete
VLLDNPRVDLKAKRIVRYNTIGTLSSNNPMVNHEFPSLTWESSHRPVTVAKPINSMARQPTCPVTDSSVTCHTFWGSLLFRTYFLPNFGRLRIISQAKLSVKTNPAQHA